MVARPINTFLRTHRTLDNVSKHLDPIPYGDEFYEDFQCRQKARTVPGGKPEAL